jgi:hypothetical protein
MTDAKKLLDSLDAEQISKRLSEMEGERRALMTLLRAARQRESGLALSNSATPKPEGQQR